MNVYVHNDLLCGWNHCENDCETQKYYSVYVSSHLQWKFDTHVSDVRTYFLRKKKITIKHSARQLANEFIICHISQYFLLLSF